jgi:hypothetical protein
VSIQIQEGKYYRRRDGQVAGPAVNRDDPGTNYPWIVAGRFYTDDGAYDCYTPGHHYDLIAEVTVTDVLPFELKAGGKYETVKPDGTVGPVVELARTSYAYGYLREAFPFSHGSPTEVVFDRHGCGFQLDARVTPDSYRCFRITAPYVAPPPTTVERLEAWRDRYVDRVCNHHEWSGELAAIIADLKHTESRPKDSTAG